MINFCDTCLNNKNIEICNKCSMFHTIAPSQYKYKNTINNDWINISFYSLCKDYKNDWLVQYCLPTNDLWLDYEMNDNSISSFIALYQLNVYWRYKIINLNDIIDDDKKNLDCAFNQWIQDPD